MRVNARDGESLFPAKPANGAETHSPPSHCARDRCGMELEMNVDEKASSSSNQSAASLVMSRTESPSLPAREVCRDFLKVMTSILSTDSSRTTLNTFWWGRLNTGPRNED